MQSSRQDSLCARFTRSAIKGNTDLHNDVTTALVDTIWASADSRDNKDTQTILAGWFWFYQDETTSATVLRGNSFRAGSVPGPIQTHAELICFIRFLKHELRTPRAELKLAWERYAREGRAREGHAQDAEYDQSDMDGTLELAIRLMFMTVCGIVASDIVHVGQIFKPSWKDRHSLTQFFETVFPRNKVNLTNGAEMIRTEQFSAWFLEKYADVQIRWTSHLPDHLILQRTNQGKYLYLFKHAGFLEMYSRMSEGEEPGQRPNESPFRFEFVHETLRTFDLLFPQHDRRSRAILKQHIKISDLDQRLAASSVHLNMHDSPRDALQPHDMRSLDEKYPYWGERLYALWRESDYPTLITKLGWLYESKKSPRSAYKAAMLALSLAVIFGIITIVFSAAQVYVTYQAWKHPSSPIQS